MLVSNVANIIKPHEIADPGVRLCVQMKWWCAVEKAGELTAGQLTEVLGKLFTEQQMEESEQYLIGTHPDQAGRAANLHNCNEPDCHLCAGDHPV